MTERRPRGTHLGLLPSWKSLLAKKSQFQIVQQFGVKRKKVSRKSKMRNGKTRGNKIGKENGVIGHTQIAKCTFWLLENDV